MAAQDPALNARAGGRAGRNAMRVRGAVRDLLTTAADQALLDTGAVGVALSGGPDSLALTDATVQAAGKLGVEVHALVVDHGLQDGSSAVAGRAADAAGELGVHSARVIGVECDPASGNGGLEAAARKARYAALSAALPGTLILLGHTRDDQAETVLLGLGRGSGARSVAGMRPLDPPWARPLLDVDRATTEQACAELGLRPWADPHNSDPRFTRVRLRTEVLPLLEDVLQGGVAGALARTATQLREDTDALDAIAADLLGRAAHGDPPRELDAATLGRAPGAIRRRAIRRWLLDAGARDLNEGHLRAVDDLVGRWRGQGDAWLAGDLVVGRAHGRLRVAFPTRTDK